MNKPLIDETIKALRARVEQLGNQRDDLDMEMSRILAIIDEWNEALAVEDNLDHPPLTGKPKRDRIRKGKAAQAVADYFASQSVRGAGRSVPEIVQATGLKASTVEAVLKRSGKYERIDGKWRRKFPEPQGTLEESADTGASHA